jgi:hypothetical protein
MFVLGAVDACRTILGRERDESLALKLHAQQFEQPSVVIYDENSVTHLFFLSGNWIGLVQDTRRVCGEAGMSAGPRHDVYYNACDLCLPDSALTLF